MILLKRLFYLVIYFLGIFAVVATITNVLFEFYFQDKIYPGVKIASLDFGRQTEAQVQKYFAARQNIPEEVSFTYNSATFSAKPRDLGLRFDLRLMSRHAYSIGRQNNNFYYDFIQKFAAVTGHLDLPIEVTFDPDKVIALEDTIAQQIEIPVLDAQFKFVPNTGPDLKGRVTTFRPSQKGLKLNRPKFESLLKSLLTTPASPAGRPNSPTSLILPVQSINPQITTAKVNRLGIKDLLGTGTSYFYDSIPGRIANIQVGAEKVSGSLVAPGETFSFNTAIGTVSAVFGFQKAYVIKENKTVLEDGGGVCQVSTTLYRAALNAGLPIVERAAHSYRVPFYEQSGFAPGLDATVYPPSPDFRFKNDTPGWLLIQAAFEPEKLQLSFDIFGSSDDRTTQIDGPYILSVSPPPAPIYEDDPDVTSGQIRQIDTPHWGAETTFTRKVTKNNVLIINEIVNSSYIPWPARFLRGTKPRAPFGT